MYFWFGRWFLWCSPVSGFSIDISREPRRSDPTRNASRDGCKHEKNVTNNESRVQLSPCEGDVGMGRQENQIRSFGCGEYSLQRLDQVAAATVSSGEVRAKWAVMLGVQDRPVPPQAVTGHMLT